MGLSQTQDNKGGSYPISYELGILHGLIYSTGDFVDLTWSKGVFVRIARDGTIKQTIEIYSPNTYCIPGYACNVNPLIHNILLSSLDYKNGIWAVVGFTPTFGTDEYNIELLQCNPMELYLFQRDIETDLYNPVGTAIQLSSGLKPRMEWGNTYLGISSFYCQQSEPITQTDGGPYRTMDCSLNLSSAKITAIEGSTPGVQINAPITLYSVQNLDSGDVSRRLGYSGDIPYRVFLLHQDIAANNSVGFAVTWAGHFNPLADNTDIYISNTCVSPVLP